MFLKYHSIRNDAIGKMILLHTGCILYGICPIFGNIFYQATMPNGIKHLIFVFHQQISVETAKIQNSCHFLLSLSAQISLIQQNTVKTNNFNRKRTEKPVSESRTRTTRKTEKSSYNDNFRKRENKDFDSSADNEDRKRTTRFSGKKFDSERPARDSKPTAFSRPRRDTDKPFSKDNRDNRNSNPKSRFERKPHRDTDNFDDNKRFSDRKFDSDRSSRDSKPSSFGRPRRDSDKPFSRESNIDKPRFEKRKPFSREENTGKPRFEERKPYRDADNFGDRKRTRDNFSKPQKRDASYDPNAKYSLKKQIEHKKRTLKATDSIRLNRFLSNAGICSRREADEYIKAGVVTVNGEVVTELGSKVKMTDKVLFHDQLIKSEAKVYILINKPKDCVTTSEDPQERYTVMDLIKGACNERVYPVGRLDRNTTGVLLLTNDGDMAARLTHPKYNKKKIYHVFLDKPLTKADMEAIANGITLEDGEIHADSISYVEEGDKKQVGIEIHSGRNRIVRRIFEHFGYKVEKLDRVYFAGLTKKNLPRGKYRFLTEKEISMLNMGAYE